MGSKIRTKPKRRLEGKLGGAAGVSLALTGRMLYPSDDRVLRFLREGWFEYRELAMMSRLIRPGDCFVDIGAHCGLYSRLASRRLGMSGTVIAVEPNPALHPFLQANLDVERVLTTQELTVGTVNIVGAAVAAENGEAVLHTGEAGWTAYSSLQPTASVEFTHAVQVTTRRLESLVVATPPGGQVIIKLDTEGLEFDIVQQAVPFLKTRDDIHLMIEFDENNQALGGRTTDELRKLLVSAGYGLAVFDPGSGVLLEHHSENSLWGANLVATKAIGLLNERLRTLPEGVAEETEDFLQSGIAAEAIYRRSEQLDPALRAIEAATGAMADIAASLEGRAVPKVLSDDNASATAAPILVANMQDQLGRLDGSARSVAQQLDAAHEVTATLKYGLAQIADRLTDHTRVAAEARTELDGQDGQALPNNESGSDRPLPDLASVLANSDRLGSEIGKLVGAARWYTQDNAASQRSKFNMEGAVVRAAELLSKNALVMADTAASLMGEPNRLADVEKAVKMAKALTSTDQLKAVVDLAVDQSGILIGMAQWLSTHGKTAEARNPELEAAVARSATLLYDLILTVTGTASDISDSPEMLERSTQAIAAAKKLPAADQLSTLVNLASDEAGRLMGAAARLNEDVARLRTDIDRHQNAIAAFVLLRGETGKAEKALQTARLDLAALIAKATSLAASKHGSTGSASLKLEHSIKTALTTAASHLSYGLRSLSVVAPTTMPLVSDDRSSELNRLRAANRDLLAEIGRLGLIADKARRSRWLKLGDRLGADATRQLETIATLIADIEKRAVPSDDQPTAKA
jgi:FkbM family methyltransferase